VEPYHHGGTSGTAGNGESSKGGEKVDMNEGWDGCSIATIRGAIRPNITDLSEIVLALREFRKKRDYGD